MTQITEDLRSSEPEDALPPALREKLLQSPPAHPNKTSILGSQTGKVNPEAEDQPLSTSSPAPQNWGGGASRKRRLPAWTFAALAVVAWFICYPLFQRVHENSPQMTSPVAAVAVRRPAPVYKQRQVAQARITGPALKQPVPPPDMPDIPAPPAMPMSVPPMPPKPVLVHAAPMVARASRSAYTANGPAPPSVIDGNGNTLSADPDSLRQVHKEAGIGIQVANPDATGDKLNDMVKETGGYVAANNLTTDTDGRKSGELIVKVPEAQFETFLAAVAKLGTVVSKNITGQDITEQTSDAHEAQGVEESDLEQAEARLKALGSHAKWEDKENTQDQRVRLAETRARLKLLKRMAALGTITIDLSETPKAAAAVPVTGGFTGTLQATTHDALQSLVGSAAALLALVIWLLAYSPIWVPLLLLGRYALKEYKKREAA